MAKAPDEFSEKEAQARFEAALRGALKTPPKPLKEKPKVKKAKPKKKPASDPSAPCSQAYQRVGQARERYPAQLAKP